MLHNHPSGILTESQKNLLRSHSAEAEQKGKLTDEQLQLLFDQNWFNLYVPKTLGGLEFTLPEIVRLEEALSWADGSAGWVVTLCSGAAFFAGYLDPQLAGELFSNPHALLAGSGASTGFADVTDNGYLINGTWLYASGILHATHLTANCTVRKNGLIQKNEDGSDMIRSFIFKKDEADILPGWNYMGMKATGSHWYEVKNTLIPLNRIFRIDPAHTTLPADIFRYPFLQLAEATLVANYSGMAIHFLDLADVCLQSKSHLTAQQSRYLSESRQLLLSKFSQSRESFFAALRNSWAELRREEKISSVILTTVSKTSRELAKHATELVDGLYPFCGMQAANSDTEINRVWRDIHTAGQHALFTFPFFENAG